MRLRLKSSIKTVVSLATVILLVRIGNFSGESASRTSNGESNMPKGNAQAVELEEVFNVRQRHLMSVCLKEGRPPPATVAESTFSRKTVVDATHRILYCPVQKVASSFLTDTLIALNSKGRIKSPFQIKQSGQVKTIVEHFGDFQNSRSEGYRSWFMANAISFLVVRDPYTKLFSAYTDKIYHPNHYFWRTTGKEIEEMLKRKNVPGCGNTVSFPDFIKYIIHEANVTDSKIDPHFTPIYRHCDPCTSRYDYIMTFENLKDEYFYLINRWNTTLKMNLTLSFTDFEKDTAMRIAEEHIAISFLTMKRYARKCNISAFNFLLRTWRFLQITGVLPKNVDIPFSNDNYSSAITKPIFLDAVRKVLSQKPNRQELKEQRHEALVQAYQGVDITDMKALIEIMKRDCAYFGYKEKPEYLFKRVGNIFNYFDGLTFS